jgi:Domain of unknown function (DUF2760)
MNNLTYDLALQPSVLDRWHLILAAAVVLLLVLFVLVWALSAAKKRQLRRDLVELQQRPPQVQVVEKIVEVEKQLPAPPPETIVLREATQDAALQLLGLLQQEARLVDFLQEDVSQYQDAEIGAAARVVHQGCCKVLSAHFSLTPVSSEQEGARITLPVGFDADAYRLTGHVVGQAPFTGTLVHKGWQVVELRLPKLTEGHKAHIIAAAEIEL